MKGGSTPRRPGAAPAESEFEGAERQVRELEQAVADQLTLVNDLHAAGRNNAGAREQLFRLTEELEGARQLVEQLKA
jgi:hypothetical protein